jgi:hypothetical protein
MKAMKVVVMIVAGLTMVRNQEKADILGYHLPNGLGQVLLRT